MAGVGDVRIQESLRVKIGEAKKLPTSSVSGGNRSTYCVLKLDNENIFKTSVVEKSSSPFYGEEFQGEIPRKFRFLSCYVYEAGHRNEKVLGKVTLRKEELYKYHGKDHWFPLSPALEANNEIQGKVHIEISFDEFLNTDPESSTSHRMAVRVVECSDLTVTNGACNPYALVTVSYGKSRAKEDVKRTCVKKKTICPQYDEKFFFDLENRGQNQDRNQYVIDDVFSGEMSISLWHDDSRVSREVLGGMFRGVFLGEVKIPLRDLDIRHRHNAWYFLQSRDGSKHTNQELGSIRLKISYTADHVFSSHYYEDLRNLLLKSPNVQPITSSAACILSEVVENLEDAAQPIMRIFLQNGKMVPLVKALAEWEISKTSDPNTLFRGNTLASKLVDSLMKLVGIPYLHDTIKGVIDLIRSEQKSCEIDPSRLKEDEKLEENMATLKDYVEKMYKSITDSGLVCPTIVCEIFFAVKDAAMKHYPESTEVRYQVVSGFIFLRFFAPAILGPRLFELTNEVLSPTLHRTLTLVSKAIQSMGNLVSSKTLSLGIKEEFMVPLFQHFSDDKHTDGVKRFLDIISSARQAHSIKIEAPIVLKEGWMIKRAQGRKKFGLKNFKRRYFCLTNHSLNYARNKGEGPLCEIPIEDILAVEKLEEESFEKKCMFQVVQSQRALYIQASNCVEEAQWVDILTKICTSNKNRLKEYHPAAFINGHWLCCKSFDPSAKGCTPVTGGLSVGEIKKDIDIDREIEKIHSLFLTNREKLEALQDACASQEVYSGDTEPMPLVHIDDTKTCFETLNEILKCVISLEQEHMQYKKMVQKQTVIGSEETPISEDNYQKYLSTMATAR
ncbi:ras GTPase-activating protein 3-like isoform X2 [Liolophura sinensis]|uniref:ras GTPase-activating protein 3-like isoform X2 n=1 Tax=Liolophura sinensis TaxID=3198878 RepID=UPI003158A3B3